MKKTVFFLLYLGISLLAAQQVKAQEKPQKVAKMEAEEEEAPLVLKFEPDFLASEEARRAEIERIKRIIDTLDISENRRLKLIRDLYRNKESKRLSRILVADTKYEDEGIDQ